MRTERERPAWATMTATTCAIDGLWQPGWQRRPSSVVPILGYAPDGTPPVVAAFRTADGVHLVIRCPWCGHLHWHGAGGPSAPDGEGDGGRVPHCCSLDLAHELQGRHTHYILRQVGRGGLSIR